MAIAKCVDAFLPLDGSGYSPTKARIYHRPLTSEIRHCAAVSYWPTSADSPPGRQAIECNVVRNFPKDGLRHQYATVPVGTSGD